MSSSTSLATLTSILLAASISLAGCSKPDAAAHESPPPTPPVATAGAVTQATEIFATRCTPCHGAEGRGDGAASASLNPKPRNFHDGAWQSSITDDYLSKIIQYGGAAVGKSPTMPANPDLRDAAVIAALAAHVRDLGKVP
jgi:mono/diheme cytochrome c family protein